MDAVARIKRVLSVGEARKVSSLARSLRIPVADVVEAASGYEGLDLIVGFRAGGGIAELQRSEWEVERYD